MSKGTLVLIGVALLSLAAESPKQELNKDDDQLLQGTWVAQSWVGFGQATPKEDLKNLRLTIKGNQITAHYGENKMAKATFRLNAARTPRQINVTLSQGPEAVRGKTFHGIYLIEGPVFRVGFTDPGKQRPSDFGGPNQTEVHDVLFHKEKP